MTPKKTKGKKRKLSGVASPSSSSPRRSRRKTAAYSPHDPSAESSTRGRQESEAVLSTLSTESETVESFAALVKSARKKVDEYAPSGREDEQFITPLFHAMLDNLCEEGQTSIAHDLVKAKDDEKIWEQFRNIYTGLLVPMMASSRRPSVIDSPECKRLSNVESIAHPFDLPEPRDPNFREQCLLRDGHKCVITKAMDLEKWVEEGKPKNIKAAHLEAAHIIPYSLANWSGSVCTSDAAKRWETLWRCFPAVRRCGMRPSKINLTSNGMMLLNVLHDPFGDFSMSFKATDNANEYVLKTYERRFPNYFMFSLPDDGIVKFECTKGAEDKLLPDPTFLDCHFKVAEILNASEMGEHIAAHLREWERMKQNGGTDGTLRPDGSTEIGRILETALWPIMGY